MSAEHKRPLFAFLVVTVLCAVMLGHAFRTEAVGGVLARVAPSVAHQIDELVDREPPTEPTASAVAAPVDVRVASHKPATRAHEPAGQTDRETRKTDRETRKADREASKAERETRRTAAAAARAHAKAERMAVVAERRAQRGPASVPAHPRSKAGGHAKGHAMGKARGHARGHARAHQRSQVRGGAHGHVRARRH